ncbi:Peptidase M12B, ADAM/reprolysin [Penicillium expansum]|uniref:Peptidase M12B, ADAM/reprolysin n=1 Tax=Penicillium expansum TaxID=27334 RepID=A0A0A2KUG8_PENEN|nr:Peptidase M12B, ADAM/reprolysin [Penicillium expansum]KGO36927.1 Peptidase M12B, ADAM/reprolysin [Penicillium expansum]KGO51408.1 Peptidase M12B, ADAM/reprolysin [Penicillium expansum]KGO71434.1 Peptidase M12B, ADAM/reprolysin [Penicillium expansum]
MKTLSFTLLALLALIVPISAVEFDPVSFRFIDPVLSPVTHTKKFNITAGIQTYNQTINFVLENNDDLISQDVQIRYPGIHGQANEAGALPDPQVRFTKGSVWMQDAFRGSQENVGWARLAVIQHGENLLFDGAFTIMGAQYAIELETLDNGSTAMKAHEHESAFTTGSRSSLPALCATAPETDLYKRQTWNAWGENLTSTIGSTYGCPNTREIANIGIMTDCTYTASFNSSDSAHQYILNMVNTASVVFENSFNISLAVQNLTISDAECPTSTSDTTAWNVPCSQGDLNTRLQTFSTWRSSVNDQNAYWTLLTGCSVSAGEIGVSWIGALCNTGSGSINGGAGANVVARTQNEWQVFA